MAKEALSRGEIDARLSELEKKMNRLRTLYEQYFMGIERIPPTVPAKEVFRLVQALENTFIRNTAQKFRLRSLVQRYNSYKTYWRRIEKQIEDGTHKRDLKRAKRNTEKRQAREDNELPMLEIELEEIQDLGAYQRELEAMDAAGRFDSHVPAQPAAPTASEKAQKLEDIRRQLMSGQAQVAQAQVAQPQVARGVEPDAPKDERSSKLDSLRRRFQERTGKGETSGLPTGGANMDRLRELAAHKKRLQAQRTQGSAPAQAPAGQRTIQRGTSSQRVIQRNAAAKAQGSDHAREVYNRLIEAKKRCNESTSGLTYESVRQSMSQQKDHLRKSRGAAEVDFKVVIKDGKAFLKPVPK